MRHLWTIGAVALALGLWTSTARAHPDYGCESCHVPHGSVNEHDTVPLWNPAHQNTVLADTPKYSSNTLNAQLGQVTGASKLCLSCHDGSYSAVATDHTFSGQGAMGVLAASHPISFNYASAQAADPELKPVDQLPAGALDGNGDVQCISCHDVHATAATYVRGDSGNNLRWKYANEVLEGGYVDLHNAAFCRNCHLK